ncbi:15354_t:CDS:2 [Rhizophagus irregularis]|nr:15354_t:CDS:2 [Rhizophagus irregularis]
MSRVLRPHSSMILETLRCISSVTETSVELFNDHIPWNLGPRDIQVQFHYAPKILHGNHTLYSRGYYCLALSTLWTTPLKTDIEDYRTSVPFLPATEETIYVVLKPSSSGSIQSTLI